MTKEVLRYEIVRLSLLHIKARSDINRKKLALAIEDARAVLEEV